MDRFQVFSSSTAKASESREYQYCPSCGRKLQPTAGTGDRQKCIVCEFTHYLNPSPGITVIIHDENGKVLIGKRSEQTEYGGSWCLPGGYVEFEESFIETAHREVEEETGLEVEIEGIINVVSNLLDDRHHTLVVVVLGVAVGGSPRPADDVTELRWVNATEHGTVDYAFEADRRIIDRYFEGDIEAIPIDPRFRLK